ncbi:MAG: hypothetical protein ACTSUK_06890 [Promethearchaeota archaeon]
MIDESLHKKPIIEKHVIENKADEFKHVGHIRKRKGLTLFQYNLSTNELNPAKISEEVFAMVDQKTGDTYAKKKNTVVREKGCDYFYALNEKTAYKKIMKSLGL